MTDNDTDTYRSRLRKYERREHMTIWVAAGVATLIAFVGAGALDDRPPLLRQLVFSTAIITGYAIARARVGFEWAATLIKRAIQDQKVQEDVPLSDSQKKWPSDAERAWTVALFGLMFGWGVMLLGIWWPQITCIVRYLTGG